jgi:hypothetical protein
MTDHASDHAQGRDDLLIADISDAITRGARVLPVRGGRFRAGLASWLLVVIAASMFTLATPAAAAPPKVCATGQIQLGSFTDHIERLRQSNRYPAEDIDKLVADERAGGPGFFSSQIIIKEEQSGSGDFDLSLFHGHSDPQTTYRKFKEWSCASADYPVAYFVGFQVKAVRDGAIFVTREKGAVTIISLKEFDPKLDKKTPVKDSQSGAVLCADIATGCVGTIFYGRW